MLNAPRLSYLLSFLEISKPNENRWWEVKLFISLGIEASFLSRNFTLAGSYKITIFCFTINCSVKESYNLRCKFLLRAVKFWINVFPKVIYCNDDHMEHAVQNIWIRSTHSSIKFSSLIIVRSLLFFQVFVHSLTSFSPCSFQCKCFCRSEPNTSPNEQIFKTRTAV